MSDFSSIAHYYRRSASEQRSVAEQLFWMPQIGRDADVLDLGCDTWHPAQEVRTLSDARRP